MEKHVVRQGECLATIALMHGFADSDYVWQQNPELRKKRADSNVLYPGDIMNIPERRKNETTISTNKRHVFQLKPVERKLSLILQNYDWELFAGVSYTLKVGSKTLKGVTGSDGAMDQKVPFSATKATLTLHTKGADLKWELKLGHLNPVNDAPDQGISGIQQRLCNLGLFNGEPSGHLCDETREAVKSFQRAFGLGASGELDDLTISKIRDSRRNPQPRQQ